MKDILLVMSDQHSFRYTEWEDGRVRTPWLAQIAAQGTRFDRCYCNSPLCVPSRMSFLAGKMPSDLQIFGNDTTLPIDMPTIAHEIGRIGYKTVLIGRMHFKGADQKHGFDMRLAGDITSQYWGTGGKSRSDFGAYAGTTNRRHCLEAVGGGYSPVMAYDAHVFETAMEYLKHCPRDGRGIFLVVGFYSPHFPFACGEKEYRRYQKLFETEECGKELSLKAAPVYREYIQQCSPEHMRNCRAAYCGLVERLDSYIGALYQSFMKLEGGREKIFFYTSDHGEQLGIRGIFGKQTLYEDSIHVPLVVAGDGVAQAVSRQPVGLLDLSRTLLELAASEREGEDFSWHQGSALNLEHPEEKRRPIRIQQMLEREEKLFLAQAVTDGRWKAVRTLGKNVLYNLKEDPLEQSPIPFCQEANTEESSLEALKGYFLDSAREETLVQREYELRRMHRRLTEWGLAKRPEEPETMRIPQEASRKPVE